MDGDLLASKYERHIDLLVARYFPNPSNIGSIGEPSTGNPAIHGSSKSPEGLVSIENSDGCVGYSLGDLGQRKSSVKHTS